MQASILKTSVLKTVGRSGQIALGKQYAGRHVLLTETEPGVWTVKLGEFIADDERWLHEPKNSASLSRAIKWAENTQPTASSIDDLQNQ